MPRFPVGMMLVDPAAKLPASGCIIATVVHSHEEDAEEVEPGDLVVLSRLGKPAGFGRHWAELEDVICGQMPEEE